MIHTKIYPISPMSLGPSIALQCRTMACNTIYFTSVLIVKSWNNCVPWLNSHVPSSMCSSHVGTGTNVLDRVPSKLLQQIQSFICRSAEKNYCLRKVGLSDLLQPLWNSSSAVINCDVELARVDVLLDTKRASDHVLWYLEYCQTKPIVIIPSINASKNV